MNLPVTNKSQLIIILNLLNKCSTKSNSDMVMKGHYEFTFTIIRLY